MSIHIHNISKSFGTFHALRDVSLDIDSGELVALLGPSGCGKTTLLRIIAGLEAADQGQLFFGEQDTTALHVRERQVGFVFQHYALFRHMSVFENVAFGLRVRPKQTRPNEAAIQKKVHDLLELVQLDWLADRYPAQLSGGQRQRIALARALAVEPKVLLLDEPFGALDAKVRKELRRWLRRLHDELSVTSIFVTHDQEEALEVADRVVLMNQGVIEQTGTPQIVLDQPASAFVVSFLGDVNLFHGRAHKGTTDIHGVSLATPEHHDAEHQAAHAYVRPHDLDITADTHNDVNQHGDANHVIAKETTSLGDTASTIATTTTTAAAAPGIRATIERIMIVGPIARVTLRTHADATHNTTPNTTSLSADQPAPPAIIEAHLAADLFRAQSLKEGDTVRVTPKQARVFLQTSP